METLKDAGTNKKNGIIARVIPKTKDPPVTMECMINANENKRVISSRLSSNFLRNIPENKSGKTTALSDNTTEIFENQKK